ncbi:MAG: ABC transporter substrate-binding protein [Hyphomicrobiales bacterium]
MRLGRRRFLAGAGASTIGAAALLAGCGDDDDDDGGSSGDNNTSRSPSAAAGSPKRGGTLRLPVIFSSGHFDIHQFVIGYQTSVWRAVGNGLFRTDNGTGETVGDLAKEWEYPDSQTFVVKLKPEAKFQNKPPMNGRKLTAEDVKFSFERLATPSADFPRNSDYQEVDRIEVVDPETIRFVMKRPYAPLINVMTNSQAIVVAPEVVEQFGDLKKGEAVMGSGPFIAERADATSGARLVRNPDYWEEGRPYLDAAEITIVSDTQTSLSAFRAGDFDAHDIAAVDLPSFRGDSNFVIEHYLSPSYMVAGVGGPIDSGPLKDMRVRQAIDLAVDRRALGNVVYPGGDFKLSSVFGHPLWSLPTEEIEKRPGYRQQKDDDLAEARKLVEAAGSPTLSIQTTPQFPSFHIDRAQVYKDNLEKVGFKVEIVTDEYAAYKEKERNKRFMLSTLALGFSGDPDAPLAGCFHSKGSRNYFSWASDKYDQILIDEQSEFDPEKRKAIVFDAQRLLLEERPVAAFNAWFVYADIGLRKSVKGARFGGLAPSGSNAVDLLTQAKDIWLDA